MSFRTRLLIFFVIIVVIPMIAAGVVLLTLTSRSEITQVDTQLAQALRGATAAYQENADRAGNALERLTGKPDFRVALARGKKGPLRLGVDRLDRQTPALRALVVEDRRRKVLARAGDRDAVAFSSAEITDPKDKRLGSLRVSNTSARGYVDEVERLTGLQAQLARDDEILASTLASPGPLSPSEGLIDIGGTEYRGASAVIPDQFNRVELSLFTPTAELSAAIDDSRRNVIILLACFLGMALASSILVVRALQGQIGQFLAAARAIGKGEFDRRVETSGRDEFAALGQEFNAMSVQLEDKIAEIERQRQELEESIRRVGEAFAAGLNAEEIVAVAVRTAVEACAADAGRALPADVGSRPMAVVGDPSPALLKVLDRAEQEALSARPVADSVAATAGASVSDAHALAASLTRISDDSLEIPAALDVRAAGVVAIARVGEPFTDSERELFNYLASRAAVSFENASLHRTIQEQAITDPLTGLSNRRHFEEILAAETARARRLVHPLGLVMIDIDGFKELNDQYGHQVGDMALVAIGKLLGEQAREIDQMARFGGDEFVAVLPETDLAGAQTLAERVRKAIEALTIYAPDEVLLSITSSLGVASLPESAADGEGLIAAADLALYEAKRGGKNRVSRSEPAGSSR